MQRIPRRSFLARSSAALATLAGWPVAGIGQTVNPERFGADFFTPDAQSAVDRGLAFLAEQQQADGSFGPSGYSRNVAVCSLAGLAFMAGGSTPSRGPFGAEVDRCIDYILENTQDSGFIVAEGAASHGPMYGHGFATLFLAEVYGMTERGDVRDKLSDAVDIIVQSQNRDGGWRYQPDSQDADISVTVCEVMALRAAKNAALHVPSETIDRCIEYVKRSQNADGGFMYRIHGGQSAFPRSAAGLVALFSAGIYDSPEIQKGMEYLMRFLPRGSQSERDGHYFYGHYYAVQAMWHVGGERWSRWYPAIRDELLARQRMDGSWMDAIGAVYATSMASIILQMPNNYLPIFQR